jgi:hypothetical protein
LSSIFLASLSSANIYKIQNHKSQFHDTCYSANFVTAAFPIRLSLPGN